MPTPKRITSAAHPNFAQRRDLLCRTVDPDLFYDDAPTEQARAKRICRRCPAVDDCLRFALKHDLSFGVWAGYDPAERQAIAKEQERRRLGLVIVLPDRPARVATPWQWAGARHAHDINRVFDAGRRFVDGELLKTVEAATGINDNLIGEAAVVLRWAADLEDEVRGGWVPLKTAVRYARAVRDAHAAAEVAA